MYTPELVEATMHERYREAAATERRSMARDLLRENRDRGQDGDSGGSGRPGWLSQLPFVSLLMRDSRAPSAP